MKFPHVVVLVELGILQGILSFCFCRIVFFPVNVTKSSISHRQKVRLVKDRFVFTPMSDKVGCML